MRYLVVGWFAARNPTKLLLILRLRFPSLTPAFVVSGSTNMRILAGSVHDPI